jgi:AsmA protein
LPVVAEDHLSQAGRRPSSESRRPARGYAGGVRRLLVGVAATILVLFGVAAGLATWLYSPAATLAAVTRQINEATGLYVAAREGPRLFLTPRPHLVMSGVAFADRNKALQIEATELRGNLKLLPLFAGRLELDSATLTRPRARVDLDAAPIDAPGAATHAAAAQAGSMAAQKADDFRLGLVHIVDGALRLRREGVDYAADRISATLDWRKVGEHALLTSALDWRGERLQLVFWVARPGMFLRGDASVVTARIDGESMRLEAQGVAQSGANARFSGRVAGSAASAREALALFTVEAPFPGPFGDAEFSAQATIAPREAAFRDLRVLVDGNAFDGELTVRQEDGRPYVCATLKSDFVALKPLLADAPPLVGPDGQWSPKPLDLPDLTGADVDVKIAARHARFGRLTLDGASMTAALRDGALDLSLAEAEAYRGRLKARFSFKPAGRDLSMHAVAQTAGVDARALLWDSFGKEAVGGGLDSMVTVDAHGESVADMVRSLNGRASLTLTDGEIAGVDFDRALRRFEKRPLSSAQDIRSGSSPLTRAQATLLIEGGVATLEDGVASGPGFTLNFTGAANLAERSLAVKAAAREADAMGKPRDKGLQIAFDLAGPWDELKIAPDPKAFIRRSGAAAPLLPEPPAEEPR